MEVRNRRKIGEALDISDQTIYQHLRANRNNGELTKMATLKVIAALLNVSVDALVDESENVSI